MKALKIAGLAVGGLAAVLVGALLIFDWNWLKPMIEARASEAIGRQVTIAELDVDLGRRIAVTLDGIRVANAPGFERDALAKVERLQLRLGAWALLRGNVVLHEIDVIRPWAQLERREAGNRTEGTEQAETNYALDLKKDDEAPDEGRQGVNIEIGRLAVVDGDIRYRDPSRKTDMRVDVRTGEPDDSGEAPLLIDGGGQFNGEKSSITFRGGSLLSFREPDRPYPVDFDFVAGDTHSRIAGTIARPLQFGGANIRLDLAGSSLAQLYPIIGLPVPQTPKYTLTGDLDYVDKTVTLTGMTGTVGASDLNGDFKVHLGDERPQMSGDLFSRKVVWGDLAGFIGAVPKEATPHQTPKTGPDAPPKVADERLLPTNAIALDKLREVDADIHYRVERFESQYVPIDRMLTNLKIEDGVLTLQPFEFGIGKGEIDVRLRLDGRQDPASTDLSADFREIDLRQIMQKTQIFDGLGRIAGKATLQAKGNSLSAMLGKGSGELQLYMTDGQISKLLLEAVGLDAAEALGFLVAKDRTAEIRCMIADAVLKIGILLPRLILLDTTDTNIFVEGAVNFQDEGLDLRIVPVAKDVSILSARTPITVTGSFQDPNIRPDAGNLAARGAAAVALGVLLTPLAALIPTIEVGPGEDHDCNALIKAVRMRAVQNQNQAAQE